MTCFGENPSSGKTKSQSMFTIHRQECVLGVRYFAAEKKNKKRGDKQKDWKTPKRGWKSFWTALKEEPGMFHKITKPQPWRARTQVMEGVFDFAQLLKRCKSGKYIGQWIRQNL